MELPENNLTSFTKHEIKRITNNYSTLVGKGSFGEVYKGALGDTLVAVKILKHYISPDLKAGFVKEIAIHSRINHKNVVTLLG